MFKKFLVGLAIATGVSSMVMVSFVCYAYWPDKDSSLPAWIQAVGSIAAIIGAGLGIAWQINDNALRAAEAVALAADDAAKSAANELLNVLKSLNSELESFEIPLRQIQTVMAEDFSRFATPRLLRVYPDFTPRFPVYLSIAPNIGRIDDDSLRTQIIKIYSELDAFFATLNTNSKLMLRSKGGSVLIDGDIKAADVLGTDMATKLPKLLGEITDSRASLVDAIDHLQPGTLNRL